jgi:DNA-binding GntR family transcriptional regulator
MAQATSRADVYDTIEVDYAFHSLVARATKNRFLAEAINQLNRGSLRLWYLAHLKLGLHDVVSHHTEIIEALRGGQRDVVEEVMRRHVMRSQSRVIKAFATGIEAAPGNGAAAWKGADR